MIKVLIWENAFLIGAMKHPGHSAVAITEGHLAETYVSWWPTGTAEADQARGFRKGGRQDIQTDYRKELGDRARLALTAGAAPRAGQTNDPVVDDRGVHVLNMADDWMQKPQHIIDIPSFDDRNLQNGQQVIGLCEANMRDWWRLYSNTVINRNTHHQYEFVSNKFNCSAVAMACLVAGGSSGFVKPDKAWFYYTPNDIRDYAFDLRRRLNEMNAQATQINAQLLAQYRSYQPARRQVGGIDYLHRTLAGDARVFDIWTEADWRQESGRNVFIGRRKEQVAAIDTQIRDYWSRGQEWDDTNYVYKSMALAEILTQVQDHIIKKPNSDRSDAVLKLGSQCMMVVKDRAARNYDWETQLLQDVQDIFA